MAKKTTAESVEEILDEAKDKLLALLGDAEQAPDDAEKGDGAEAPEDDKAELPGLETIQEMARTELDDLALKLNIEVEGRKTSEVRKLLETVHHVVSNNEDVEEDDVNALAEAVSIQPAKKLAVTIEKLQEYFEVDEDGDGTEGADKEPAADADEDDKPKKKGKKADPEEEPAEEPEADELPKCVQKAKLPKEAVMQERLEAYNEAQEDDDAKIEVDEDDLESGYRKLLARLVDDEGNLAEWGEAYVKDEAACCCGLACEDASIKGDDREFAKCLVTGKMFFQNDEELLEEFVPKAKKK